MSNTVIKPNKGRDFYVVWESITESPVFAGDRAELTEYGTDEGWREVQERIHRADLTGSSALWYRPSWEEDKGEMYEQRGYIRRSQMRAFIDSMTDALEPTAETLEMLEPMED